MPTRAAVWLKHEGGRLRVRGDRFRAGSTHRPGRGDRQVPDSLPTRLCTGNRRCIRNDAAGHFQPWRRMEPEIGAARRRRWLVADRHRHRGGADLPAPGGDPAALAGALDCDLGLSPVTNLMRILRHGLLSGVGQAELTAAWVSVPDLRVQPDAQRYTSAGSNLIQYDALDGSFSALITVDDEGLVIDYPGIAHRI